MAGNHGDALSKATLGLGRVVACVSGHGAGALGALRALVVVLTPAATQSVLGLGQAFAAAHAVQETL